MATAAGWFSDPYGRYEQRYWDGAAWTEHVSTGGVQSVDSLGDSTVIPFAIPASAFPEHTSTDETTGAAAAADDTAGDTGTTQPRAFLDSLGPDARIRPTPWLSVALAGGGGALVAIGIAALIIGDSASRGRAFGAAIVILAGALATRLVVEDHPDLRSAAVGAGVVGLLVLGGAIVFDDVGDAWGTLVVGLLFLAVWVLPGFRGRSIMLGIGALLMVAALGAATSSDDAGGADAIVDLPFSAAVGDQHVVFLLAAAALLGLVWWLDRAGYVGVGTSLVVAALVCAFVGVAQATSNLDDVGSSLLIVAVGLFVCFIGSHGDRRATTWWGAVLATIGVVGFFAATITPDSIRSTAGMFLGSGALLIGGPAIVRAIRAAQHRTGQASPGPTASTLPPPSM